MSAGAVAGPAGGHPHARVSPDPIDAAALLAAVAHPSAGAAVLFTGMVRDHSPGRDGVTRLDYEAYGEVVEDRIAAVIAEARERWPLLGAAVAHRIGSLGVGEVTVAVAASAAHRADAFEAGRYLIDEVKRRAPIWKKEHWPGGAEWVREGGGDD
ncbi:MAG: molybdenum cofactor biosynthesis protein MoaE [Actinobacteria bacterium]|nr:molybdenum cofactor biosynthesis protein MoaE [Actinomycetota bacterium]